MLELFFETWGAPEERVPRRLCGRQGSTRLGKRRALMVVVMVVVTVIGIVIAIVTVTLHYVTLREL